MTRVTVYQHSGPFPGEYQASHEVARLSQAAGKPIFHTLADGCELHAEDWPGFETVFAPSDGYFEDDMEGGLFVYQANVVDRELYAEFQATMVFTTIFGHIDNKGWREAKWLEIYDWLLEGDLEHGDGDLVAEWREYDAEDVEANRAE